MIAHIAHSLVVHQRIIYADNHITLLQTSLSGRHIGIRLIYYHTIQLLMFTDKGSNTRILSRQHHPQVLRFVLCIIFCIGIQTPKHCIDARADSLLRIQRINIQQFEVLVQLIENIKMLAHLEVMILTFLC